jgi:hypothetical protein
VSDGDSFSKAKRVGLHLSSTGHAAGARCFDEVETSLITALHLLFG